MFLTVIGIMKNLEYFFDIPTERSLVIKNGIDNIKPRNLDEKIDKIKLIFHPTPWRGLNVMLAAMQYIKNPNIELDVYSSTEVYGQQHLKKLMINNGNLYMNKQNNYLMLIILDINQMNI